MNNLIVLIDDDVDTLECLRIALKRQAFQVAAAMRGIDGLALARAQRPSVVVVDVMMPDMNGLEVCRRLRADPATAGVPIVLLTARSEIADQTAGIEAGADRYVVKPVPLATLTNLVKELAAQAEPLLPA